MARNVYSVGQVNAYIENMFRQDFLLNRISVKGEVSNCKYHSSGHIYFSLKDESGTMACVMFAGQRSGLVFRLENGQSVVVSGTVSVYTKGGSYQLYARSIRLDGEGVLYERFLQLKKELEEMGMFDPGYKQPIPRYAKRVGIVTASTGAAIRDIVNVASRRNPYVQLILYPAQVQGEGAKESIVRGIRTLDEQEVDVIIVGRGGGSVEDLWAFNEEEVARAIFECRTPIISAVGHETDTTIADYVADLRAPTPSAAAELAVYDYRQVIASLEEYRRRMQRGMKQSLESKRLRMKNYDARLRYLHPKRKLDESRMRTVDAEEKLTRLFERTLLRDKHRFSLYVERLKGLSPLQKLSSGYAYVRDGDGNRIRSVRQVKTGEELSVFVSDGEIRASVVETSVKDDRNR